METLFIYLLKASGLITAFLLAYHFFLRKETFFESNRWYLLLGLIISMVLPSVTFTKTVWVEPAAVIAWTEVLQHQPPAPVSPSIDWWLVIGIVYGIGALVLSFKFLVDCNDLRRVLKGQKVWRRGDYKLVDVEANIPPFSFWNYIVYNSDYYNDGELNNIIEHEKVHCSQNHTADVILARLFCIFFWWNPFVWLYQKAMLQNLEFIADNQATRNLSDKKSYQFTLLKITTHDGCVAISNHFYQSLIKKRIVMLNKNQSKKANSWKYGIVVPALAVFLLQFQVDVVAQVKPKEDGATISKASKSVTEMRWTKDSPDSEFKRDADLMKSSGIDFKFSKIKRNPNGEITGIKLSYNDNLGNKQTKVISGTEPIKPIIFKREIDQQGNGSIGLYEENSTSGMAFAAPKTPMAPHHMEFPEAPKPPTPPAMPNFPAPPAAPEFPTPPSAPDSPMDENNASQWEAFNQEMKAFAQAYQNSDEMKRFQEEMKDYAAEMSSVVFDDEAFQKEMETFKVEMKKWELLQKMAHKRNKEALQQDKE